MNEPTGLSFERVTYRDGQRLRARDLSDDHTRETRLRQLHTRYLHETWGIATGFDVQAAGPSAIAVGPGYALDDRHRELLLSASLAIPVPDVAGPSLFVLVMSFDPGDACACAPRGDSVCLGSPLDPGLERPLFAWRTVDNLHIGADVPLCSVTVLSGIIQGGVETRVRRYARRLVRPHFETGITDVDQIWQRSLVGSGAALVMLKCRVSTAEAGFMRVPLYFADIVIQPSPLYATADVEQAIARAGGHIVSTAHDGFEYAVVVEYGLHPAVEATCAVSWLAIEPLGGCPPSLRLERLMSLAFLPMHLHV